MHLLLLAAATAFAQLPLQAAARPTVVARGSGAATGTARLTTAAQGTSAWDMARPRRRTAVARPTVMARPMTVKRGDRTVSVKIDTSPCARSRTHSEALNSPCARSGAHAKP